MNTQTLQRTGLQYFTSLNTEKSEPKEVKNKEISIDERPWVGSFYGIPSPTVTGSYSTAEVEIHMLTSNLKVEVLIAKEILPHLFITEGGTGFCGMYEPQDLSIPLKEIAWARPDCIAAVIYYSYIDSRTDKRHYWGLAPKRTLMMRVDQRTWQYLWEDGRPNGNPFKPLKNDRVFE